LKPLLKVWVRSWKHFAADVRINMPVSEAHTSSTEYMRYTASWVPVYTLSACTVHFCTVNIEIAYTGGLKTHNDWRARALTLCSGSTPPYCHALLTGV
jgi:hypothetical protein